MVQKINEDDFKKLTNSEKLTIIDYYADWCQPCRLLAPILQKVAEDFKEQINCGKVDIDTEFTLAEQFQITSIPTLIFFRKGQVVDRVTGLLNEKLLKEKIQTLLTS